MKAYLCITHEINTRTYLCTSGRKEQLLSPIEYYWIDEWPTLFIIMWQTLSTPHTCCNTTWHLIIKILRTYVCGGGKESFHKLKGFYNKKKINLVWEITEWFIEPGFSSSTNLLFSHVIKVLANFKKGNHQIYVIYKILGMHPSSHNK